MISTSSIPNSSSQNAKYRIENVVATFSIKKEIDLNGFCAKYRDADYNPKRFPGLCVRLKNPRATILIFKNGNVVLTGLNNSKIIPTVSEKIISKFKEMGLAITTNPEIKIVNIVVSVTLPNKLDLDQLSLTLNHTVYEPEIFPGLIYRIDEPHKAALLIFSSGKVIITGVHAEEMIVPIIKSFGKTLRQEGLLL